jgi:hypothetical protein
MLATRLVYETKESQPESAGRTKLIFAQSGVLDIIDELEILVTDPCPAGETEESRLVRTKIDVTEIAKGKPQRWENFVLAVLMLPPSEILDFVRITPAFIARRHVAHLEWAETERALDFLHVADS